MTNRIRSIALLPLLLCAPLAQPALADSSLATQPTYSYQLIDTFEVKGRQGVTSDGEFFYVSGSKSLYKYDKSGKLLQSNETPFEGYPIPANHIGGIDVFNGERCIGLLVAANTPSDEFGTVCAATRDLKRLKHQGVQHAIPESHSEERPERRSLA